MFGVYSGYLQPYQVSNNNINPYRIHLISCNDSLATITAAGYLNTNLTAQNLANINPGDGFEVTYAGGALVKLSVSIVNGVYTLVGANSLLSWVDLTASAAALATAGKVNVVVASSSSAQYIPRDWRVNYSASGLSGGGGDRLLKLTDGTTIYNNAGITAALLGTPVNTLLGGSGNPVAGTVAMNTSTAAGANLYFQYAGGTTDFTTGSVSLSVLVQKVA